MFKFEYNQQPAQIEFYTQQIITTALDGVYGHEFLCRGYLTSSRNPIPTDELINYCCNTPSLILDLTCCQINTALKQQTVDDVLCSYWINISGPLIANAVLFKQLWQRCLHNLTSTQKNNLVLEICESDIGNDMVIKRLEFLKKHGFVIAMDDFGSGHSNLLRLTLADFDIIKLDLNLLRHVPTDLWASSFYREVVDLCASKGCVVVAEGVETQIQSDFVRWAGIDLIQGFLYSKPAPLFSR